MVGLAKRIIQSLLRRRGLVVHSNRYLERRQAAQILQIEGALRALGSFSLPHDALRDTLLANLLGTTISEGLYICQRLSEALNVPGEVCEFGVAQGATSALLAHEINHTTRRLWLYDSFKGLPAPTREDALINDIYGLGSMEAYAGTMRSPERLVRSRLAALGFPEERVVLVPGFFTHHPGTPGPERICFSFVDFDLYKPITDALAFIDERMSPGGWVIVDDYGYFSAGAQRAVDEFRARRTNAWEFSLPYDFAGQFCCLHKIA